MLCWVHRLELSTDDAPVVLSFQRVNTTMAQSKLYIGSFVGHDTILAAW